MASGVQLDKVAPHVLSGMIHAQLDNDLAEYYKLMAILFAIGRDSAKAQECVNKYIGLKIPEMGDIDAKYKEKVQKILDDMDGWLLQIDKSSLPPPKGRILRKEPLQTKLPRRRTRST